ncbi:MAG: glycosyltransferase [Caulobacteraceae bacterium]
MIAVVPARDEADVIGRAVGSLLAQDYPGPFRVILVDDQSSDGTADIARRAVGAEDRLQVIEGKPLPAGWTGKLWALAQGVEAASAVAAPAYSCSPTPTSATPPATCAPWWPGRRRPGWCWPPRWSGCIAAPGRRSC